MPTPVDARDLVLAWGQQTYPDAGERLSVARIGRGEPLVAYAVRVGDPGSRPEVDRPVVVWDDTVWTGRSGWLAFLEKHGRDDALAVATAWLLLYEGEGQVPFGPGRTYKKKEVPGPSWSKGELSVVHSGARGPVTSVLVLDDEGRVEIRSQKPWRPAVEF